jgi:hypothetical protein
MMCEYKCELSFGSSFFLYLVVCIIFNDAISITFMCNAHVRDGDGVFEYGTLYVFICNLYLPLDCVKLREGSWVC